MAPDNTNVALLLHFCCGDEMCPHSNAEVNLLMVTNEWQKNQLKYHTRLSFNTILLSQVIFISFYHAPVILI